MISILTPTYNRASMLPQLYESLCRQKCFDFEWVVVDDGSTDGTEALIKYWMNSEQKFDIVYIKQENGGKHRAINKGIPYLNYPYTYILDSDDFLTDDAIEVINNWINSIMDWGIFAGVAGMRMKADGTWIGQFPKGKEFVDATNIERKKMHLLGDKAEIYKTDVLKRYPFPEFPKEKFLSECAVWDKIALDGYKLRWFGKGICICEYREDGLTRQNGKEKNNFNGYTYVIKQQLAYDTLKGRLGLVAQYHEVAKENGLTINEVCYNLEVPKIECLSALFLNFFYQKVKEIGKSG